MPSAVISISKNPVQPRAIAISPAKMQMLVSDVAKRSFIELAVSLAIGTTAALFTATPLHVTIIFAAITVQTICNVSLRCADSLAAYMPECQETRWIRSASPYLCTTLFAYLTAGNGQILLHELGHAIGAIMMYREANPQITLTPCLGGTTRFSTTHLSSWGAKIGRSNAILIATLMGPACSLIVSGVAIAVGFAIEGKFPELGSYLIGVGKGDYFAHSAYALTALSSSPASQAHDYVRLRTYGIHPLAASIAIISIPILIARFFEKKGSEAGTAKA